MTAFAAQGKRYCLKNISEFESVVFPLHLFSLCGCRFTWRIHEAGDCRCEAAQLSEIKTRPQLPGSSLFTMTILDI